MYWKRKNGEKKRKKYWLKTKTIWEKNINLHTQKAQQTPSKINIKNKYLIYSQTAESQKQKILKATRKQTNKQTSSCTGEQRCLNEWLLIRNNEGQRQLNHRSVNRKTTATKLINCNKTYQPITLYLASAFKKWRQNRHS